MCRQPNRRLRDRMNGGVGGRGLVTPSYPIAQKCPEIKGFLPLVSSERKFRWPFFCFLPRLQAVYSYTMASSNHVHLHVYVPESGIFTRFSRVLCKNTRFNLNRMLPDSHDQNVSIAPSTPKCRCGQCTSVSQYSKCNPVSNANRRA